MVGGSPSHDSGPPGKRTCDLVQTYKQIDKSAFFRPKKECTPPPLNLPMAMYMYFNDRQNFL